MSSLLKDRAGEEVSITAKIEEHLVYGKKEWFMLRFEDGSHITIRTKYIKEIAKK